MTGSIDLGIEGIADGEEIGRGGFGTVFRARQVNVGRVVAVKVLSAVSLSDETLRRFERECRAMAAVSSHPNITALYDSGVSSSGRPYIVMEHVAGGSLAPRLPLAWPDAVEIGVKVAGALETAHRIGIYHRDVKPENILVSAYGEPMLADFGVAKVADSSETPSGNITASLLHAAPETLSGARPSAATDVYSLASTLFTLIAGSAPFAAEQEEESLAPLITRIATAAVPDLRPDGVPDAVCVVLERGLAKEPETRPATPAEFGEQLREAQVSLGLAPTEMLIEGRDRAPSGAFARPADPDDETTISRSRSQVIPVLLAAGATGTPEAAPSPWWRRRVPTVAAGVAAALLLAGSAYGVTQLRADDPVVAMQTSDREEVEGDAADDEPTGGETGGPPGEPTASADGSDPLVPPADGDAPVSGDGEALVGSAGASDGGGAVGSGGTSTGAGTVTPQEPSTTTTQPQNSNTTTGTTTTVLAPGVPGSVSARDVAIVSRYGAGEAFSAGTPKTVAVTLAWSGASGTSPTYCLRWANVGSSHSGTAGCTTATSARVTVPANHTQSSWTRWEVRATNSAGSSAWAQASAVVPNAVGAYSWDAYQYARIVGLVPSETQAASGDDYRVVSQNRSSGAVVGAGSGISFTVYNPPPS
ncbi:MAG: serine/threonine-protein kinase [Actinomycetes bacterium]